MSVDSAERRDGEIAHAVLVALIDAPEGLPMKEAIDRVRTSEIAADEESIRRTSMELAKAGWLTKSAGTWRITDKGISALGTFSDPAGFYRAAVRRRDPSVTPAGNEDVGDIFAGGFLSIAGSMVGSIIGTIVLFVRLPDLSLVLLVGFAVAFIVGVVVGFFAMFGMSGIARSFGRHAEVVWVGGTALIAAISAALTASLLFPV